MSQTFLVNSKSFFSSLSLSIFKINSAGNTIVYRIYTSQNCLFPLIPASKMKWTSLTFAALVSVAMACVVDDLNPTCPTRTISNIVVDVCSYRFKISPKTLIPLLVRRPQRWKQTQTLPPPQLQSSHRRTPRIRRPPPGRHPALEAPLRRRLRGRGTTPVYRRHQHYKLRFQQRMGRMHICEQNQKRLRGCKMQIYSRLLDNPLIRGPFGTPNIRLCSQWAEGGGDDARRAAVHLLSTIPY